MGRSLGTVRATSAADPVVTRARLGQFARVCSVRSYRGNRAGTARFCSVRIAIRFVAVVAGILGAKSWARCASTAKRGWSEASAALAATFVASRYSSWPQTSPAAMHCSTIVSKKRRKTSSHSARRMRLRLEWSGSGSVRS